MSPMLTPGADVKAFLKHMACRQSKDDWESKIRVLLAEDERLDLMGCNNKLSLPNYNFDILSSFHLKNYFISNLIGFSLLLLQAGSKS